MRDIRDRVGAVYKRVIPIEQKDHMAPYTHDEGRNYTNTDGHFDLGRLLKRLDIEAYNVAALESETPTLVTAAMEGVEITEKLKLGMDYELEMYVTNFGKSALEVCCEVYGSERVREGNSVLTCTKPLVEFYFTFVSVGNDGRPAPLNRRYDRINAWGDKWDAGVARAARYKQERKEPMTTDDITRDEWDMIKKNWESRVESGSVPISDTTIAPQVAFKERLTNRYGTIFGGETLSLSFENAWTHAYAFNGKKSLPLVAAINRVNFHRPIMPDQVVEFRTSTVYTGRTSQVEEVRVLVGETGNEKLVSESYYTMVNMDKETEEPIPVAKQVVPDPTNAHQIVRWVQAHRRREERNK